MAQFSTTVSDLIARLTAQNATGNILAGWKLITIPMASVEGLADLPGVAVYVPAISGTYRPSGIDVGTMRLHLAVATNRLDGLAAHINGVEKVLDAISLDATTGQVQPALKGTRKPFAYSVQTPIVVDTSLTTQLIISVEAKPVLYGSRRI
jgi:hypothetical protein